MTITLTWWAIPVAIMLVSVVAGFILAGRGGSYDFVSPLIGAGIILIGLAAGIGIIVGHWMGGP